MFVNYLTPTANGIVPSGPIAERLSEFGFDTGFMRPFVANDGHTCVTINTGQFEWDDKKKKSVPKRETVRLAELFRRGMYNSLYNNASSLSKQQWELFDSVVLKVQRERLGAWADMSGWATYGGFNGMAKLTLEHETMNDPGEAQVDFDALSENEADSPQRVLEGLPLPITHMGFGFSLRRLTVSRNSGEPLDTTMMETAARRIMEKVEDTIIGTQTGVRGFDSAIGYGRTPQVYGYQTFPTRITKNNLTVPNGTNAKTTVSEVLAMIELAAAKNFHGPFMLYHSPNWEKWMDDDYIPTGGNNSNETLRGRLRKIEKIRDVRQLDRMTTSGANDYRLILVQMTGDVARAVNGMGMQTVMWETKGGLKVNFKTMAIYVPQIRADYNGSCGIVDARTP